MEHESLLIKSKKSPPRKAPAQKSVGYGGILAWVIPSFIICGFMFALGVMVGRNTAPVRFDVDTLEEVLDNLQHRDATMKAEKEKMMADASGHGGSDDILSRLRDKGELPEIYQQYVPPLLKPKYPKTPPPKADARLAANLNAPETETAVAQDMETASIEGAPGAAPAPTPQPGTTETASAEIAINETPAPQAPGKFAIQVASLKDLDQARLLMNKFKEKGYPAFFQSSDLNGQTWHRIRIGPYPDREAAVRDQNRLKQAGVDCLVLSTQ